MNIKDFVYLLIIVILIALSSVIHIATNSSHKAELSEIAGENTQYASQIDSLQDKLEETKQKAKEIISSLQKENNELQSKIDELKALPVARTLTVEKKVTLPVTFVCENLKLSVEDALGVKDPNSQDMLKLITLPAANRNIVSLIGLEYATNLEEIIIPKNKVSKLDPLSSCKKLKVIVSQENQISDISCISNFPDLTQLNIGWNPVKDISIIYSDEYNFKDTLTVLGISTIKVRNISWIWKMKQLNTLVLRQCGLSSISGIQNLQQLKYIDLYGNSIRDFRPLLYIKTIEEWDIGKNSIDSTTKSNIEQALTNIKNSIR